MKTSTINKVCVGEALVGSGNEVAHVDLIIGPRGSGAETAFCIALTNQKRGDNSLLSVVAPNLMTKPPTVMFNKVDIKNAKQAVQMFGPAQCGVAAAVAVDPIPARCRGGCVPVQIHRSRSAAAGAPADLGRGQPGWRNRRPEQVAGVGVQFGEDARSRAL